MLIRTKRDWELPESAATPESVYINRRALMAGAGAIAGGLALGGTARAADAPVAAPARNPAYTLDRPVTPEAAATSYNNFYEFGTSKDVVTAAQKMPLRPWTLRIDGMVEKPLTLGVDDLLKAMPVEERLYRHRCVEAWAMAVPWMGFPLAKLVAFAKPLSSATYVELQTFGRDTYAAPGLRQPFYPWPYVEGLTMAEATNDLAFISTGLYGKPLQGQNGAPLRLTLPWKYGFKSVKSIVRISFTDKKPKTFWALLNADEYGFWANVNPAVPHPRWSQAHERLLGSNESVPTQIFNGYGAQVAGLYKGLEKEALFM
ncbi:protein-methionine-sulfoxide reductase catalytic subunit MsrP [Nitrospirillum viridazoti]|uniref:Protein-methionine-sulfoxide reductase catalytic subunit MsrP n=1 Tax=Nitrospirillum amazonense TaxID=28077 RepID=A0A560I6G4_9PROT|nr:protein-methionine-sulfoxide reductase catalytic subunit MsrP [Nitrospirillum amazonense]TWB52754.1 sulfoxide reductase catalytic subunit YedY [Nitrospirillum amazonense]